MLLVPVHLDALVLDEDRMVVEAMADFSRLPYCDGTADVNSDVANISEEIVSPPFQNQNLPLRKGIHLHWSLPDALTRARHGPTGQDFPPVPNLWLVTRCKPSGQVEKEWIIESDYLHPVGDDQFATSVTIPYRLNDPSQTQPYRYMGRSMELSAWSQRQDGNHYPKLTAVGYGEPAFAAFYPNCHSVFGFYDDDLSAKSNNGRYDLIGWYRDPGQDFLGTVIGALQTNEARIKALQDEFAWRLASDEQNQDVPTRMLCYASLVFGQPEPPGDDKPISIAVGNTGTEALSAYVANTLGGSKAIIEDQLESLGLGAKLEHRQLDIGQKFLEARHENGFTASPGGSLWTIKLESTMIAGADVSRVDAGSGFPDTIAQLLNTANDSQQDYDRAWADIESLRRQLFSDWYKYMVCAYPPEDTRDEYPNIDEVRSFIERNIAFLNGQIAITGTLPADQSNGKQSVSPSGPGQSLADKLEAAIAALRLEIDTHNRDISLFSVGDFIAPASLIQKLQARQVDERTHAVSKYIHDQLSQSTRELIDKQDPSQPPNPDLLKALATELNRLLQDPALYDPQRFKGVQVSTSTKELIDQHPQDLALVCLNRALLESAYPLELAKKTTYRLKKTPGPRYWQPNEPVVLITGDAVKATERHGQDGSASDGLLETQILADVDTKDLLVNPNLRLKIRERIIEIGRGSFAFSEWTAQPWNPILLEWEVEVFPVENRSNLDPASGSYDPEFIAGNFSLSENEVDLAGNPTTTGTAIAYSGRSILTPHAGLQLKKQIEAFLNKEILPQYYQDKNISTDKQGRAYLDKNTGAIQQWYEQTESFKALKNKDEDPVYTALRAWETLAGLDCLSQSLGGFNEALLMHKQTLQLAISDPLGFDDYQSFATSVSDAVSNSIYSAPEPLNDFNPIRSGVMKVLNLRLVDTFGQVKDLHFSKVITSEPMTSTDPGSPVRLAPRLVQPARINFRWLAAESDEQEMNDHPATTPICGWLLTNNLDNSLMIYNQRGKALGSLVNKDSAQHPAWLPAPGGGPDAVNEIDHIDNSHLQKMVASIHKNGAKFLSDFITAIDNAMENIEPENFAQHQDLALLMGRPVALVRAAINLELQGLPGLDQSWTDLWQDMQRETRDDNRFSEVQFPIRIGEYEQFNDGTVGYWKGDGYEGDVFYAPQSNEDVTITDIHLKTRNNDPLTISQSVKSERQILSLLIDPRGLVHATSGIQPAKAIRIPPDQYADALQAIEITFLSTPILTDAGKIHLPLPVEPGYRWSWLQQDAQGLWTEVSTTGVIRKSAFNGFQVGADAVWKELRDQRWIEIDPPDSDRALVRAKDQRTSPTLAEAFKDKTAEIEDILDRTHIGPINPGARFAGPQEIREGWLKLSVDQTVTANPQGQPKETP